MLNRKMKKFCTEFICFTILLINAIPGFSDTIIVSAGTVKINNFEGRGDHNHDSMDRGVILARTVTDNMTVLRIKAHPFCP